jgi:hypothetical protein
MLPVWIRQKIMAYRPYAGTTVQDELKWYFHFLNQGYPKRAARKHAMYYLVGVSIERERYDLWQPEVEPEEIEIDDLENLDFYEEEEEDESY